jgi:hypothetical protein
MAGFDGELFAERLRLDARAQAHAAGDVGVTTELPDTVTTTLAAAWDDANRGFQTQEIISRKTAIDARGRRSIGRSLSPSLMELGPLSGSQNETLLSLVEAEHEVLVAKAEEFGHAEVRTFIIDDADTEDDFVEVADGKLHSLNLIRSAPESFRLRVNEIFEAHDVAFRLSAISRLVPVASHVLSDAIVAPTQYLLHGQPEFAGAESAYQKALTEIRNGDPGDAITDAGTALQAALTALGCKGGTLGQLLASAKNDGLLRGNDTPLTESIAKAVNWVAALRNDGEAHNADIDFDLSDAWMVVHVVGALIVRLADAAGRRG